MLTTKSEEKFGKISLQQHYEKINIEGQVRNKQLSTIFLYMKIQEYDPYTTMLAKKK